jgi:hypothetical protein
MTSAAQSMLWCLYVEEISYQPLFEDPRWEPLDCRDPFWDFKRGSSLDHLWRC